eukprot:TRINITY_DN71204_c0_g1_i1.p1 TRINITY_DN71204_c0_g1~~TRINITY_DN71204_c0_g1_i1.p1  ORF type:complete len:268 (+),score=59.66 TRINITY_DN71204_c0_g1_i1:90-893(+)
MMSSPRSFAAAGASADPSPTAVIGSLIDAVTTANVGVPLDTLGMHSCFESSAVLQSFSEYMHRFRRFRSVDALWVQALVLAHRLQARMDLPITPENVHRLMLTCFLITAKLHIENSQANKIIGSAGGCPTDELTAMECALLTLMDWSVLVLPEEYSLVMDNLDMLEAHTAAVGGGDVAPLLPEALAHMLDNRRAAVLARGSTKLMIRSGVSVRHSPAPPKRSSTSTSTSTSSGRPQMQPARRGGRLQEAVSFGRLVVREDSSSTTGA